MPMLNLACFDKQAHYRCGELKHFTGESDSKHRAVPGDLLIACTDLTRNADIIGRPIIVPKEANEYCFSTDLAKLMIGDKIGKHYLCHSLRMDAYHKYIKPFASGTTVLHLNISGVLNYRIVKPGKNIMHEFESIASTITTRCADLIAENDMLVSLRDTLLPLLINGQVVVK